VNDYDWAYIYSWLWCIPIYIFLDYGRIVPNFVIFFLITANAVIRWYERHDKKEMKA
jgi:hypothetical protein